MNTTEIAKFLKSSPQIAEQTLEMVPNAGEKPLPQVNKRPSMGVVYCVRTGAD
jgi:hypothetical protein